MKIKSYLLCLGLGIMSLLSLDALSSPNINDVLSLAPANCPHADPVTSSNFCTSFKSVAECHCIVSGLPQGMCKDMNAIYNRMLSVFGSQQKACEYQKDVSTQECMDDWNCYRSGGTDSKGNLCSGTGKACQ